MLHLKAAAEEAFEKVLRGPLNKRGRKTEHREASRAELVAGIRGG